jgi:hypothetical protein
MGGGGRDGPEPPGKMMTWATAGTTAVRKQKNAAAMIRKFIGFFLN